MPWEYKLEPGVTMVNWDWDLLKRYSEDIKLAAYQARWGENSAPDRDDPDRLEAVRSEFWELNRRSIPKCFGCRNGNLVMPQGNNAPRGNDDEDLLPCGCRLEDAIYEPLLAKDGLFAPGFCAGKTIVFLLLMNTKVRVVPPNTKDALWTLVKLIFGPDITLSQFVGGATGSATALAAGVREGHITA